MSLSAPQSHDRRIFREETERTVAAYGRDVTGSVWTVTIQDMDDAAAEEQVVGTQLIEGATQGINRLNVFLEHIGCSPCTLFEAASLRRGPWVLDPAGSKLVRATSAYSKKSSCRRHKVSATHTGFGVQFESGGDYEAPATWNKELWSAPEGVPLPAMPTPAPTPAATAECASHAVLEERLAACRTNRGLFAWTCDDPGLRSPCGGPGEFEDEEGVCRVLCEA